MEKPKFIKHETSDATIFLLLRIEALERENKKLNEKLKRNEEQRYIGIGK